MHRGQSDKLNFLYADVHTGSRNVIFIIENFSRVAFMYHGLVQGDFHVELIHLLQLRQRCLDLKSKKQVRGDSQNAA